MRLPPGVDDLDAVYVQGRQIALRPVRPEDVRPRYVSWLADPEVNRYLETRWQEQTPERIHDFVQAVRSEPSAILFAIIERETDRHVGNIKLGDINPHHRTGIISLFIGEKDVWGRGYASEAIGLTTDYAGRIGLRKVTAGCYSVNMGSERAFLKNGFVIEGRQRAQYLLGDGSEVDEVLLGKLL